MVFKFFNVLTLILLFNFLSKESISQVDIDSLECLYIEDDVSSFNYVKEIIDCRLNEFKENDNLYEYHSYIITLYMLLSKNEKKSLDVLDLDNRKQWRSAKTKKEQVILRDYFARFGYYIKEVNGDFSKSEFYYKRALELDKKINDSAYHWYIHNPLANIYTRLGDHEKAIILFNACEGVLKKNKEKYRKELLRIYPNLAIAYKSVRRYSEAITLCQEIIKISGITSTRSILNSRLILADIYHKQHKTEKALKELKQSSIALKKLYKQSKTSDNLSYYYQRLSEFHKLKAKIIYYENPIKSQHYFQEAIANLRMAYKNEKRREFGKIYISYGNLLLKSKKENEARNMANLALKTVIKNYDFEKQSIPSNAQLYPENTILEALDLKGHSYQLKYQESKNVEDLILANQCYKSALKVSQLLRSEYLFNDSKFITLKDNKSLIESSLGNLFLLQQLDSLQNYATQVTSLLAQSKSNILAEKRAYTFVTRQMSKPNRTKYNLINNRIDSIANINIEGTDYVAALDEKKIFLDSLVRNNLAENRKPFTNYIDYFVGVKRAYAFVSINDNKKLFDLGSSKEIKKIIANHKSLLQTSYQHQNKKSFEEILKNLHKRLIQPLGLLPYELAIIPDEELFTISFESLMNGNGNFLIQDHLISYHYETLLNDYLSKKSNHNALVFSPTYKKSSNPNLALLRDDLYNIPGATNESYIIKDILNSDLFSGVTANKTNFIKKIRTCNILHFAGHAILDSINETHLAFSSYEGDKEKLTLKELDTLNIHLDLLTLSACNTASGKIQPGEGTFSLARAFHGVGAESIISTLWKISDETSSEIMVNFYKNIKSGFPKNKALRSAKLEYLENADPDYRHPYYWSGIILIGNIDPLYSKITQYLIYMLGICVLLILVLYFSKRMNAKVSR